MNPMPNQFHLENLAVTLRLINPADLLVTQFSPFVPKKTFPIQKEMDRDFVVKKSGWAAPSRGAEPLGESLTGFGASEIEFDIKVTDLHHRVRAFYRDGQFVGLQYEAEPWEREYIVSGSASYEGGFYTLGESFYKKIGGLTDDAVKSLYCSVPPEWWLEMHPEARETPRKHLTKSIDHNVSVNDDGTAVLELVATAKNGQSLKKIIRFDSAAQEIVDTTHQSHSQPDLAIPGKLYEYRARAYFHTSEVEDIGIEIMRINRYPIPRQQNKVVLWEEDGCLLKVGLYYSI